MAQAQKEFSIVGKKNSAHRRLRAGDGQAQYTGDHPTSRHALRARAAQHRAARQDRQHRYFQGGKTARA